MGLGYPVACILCALRIRTFHIYLGSLFLLLPKGLGAACHLKQTAEQSDYGRIHPGPPEVGGETDVPGPQVIRFPLLDTALWSEICGLT